MEQEIPDLDYCGIINLLRALIQQGTCTAAEAKRIARRIAEQLDVSITFPL